MASRTYDAPSWYCITRADSPSARAHYHANAVLSRAQRTKIAANRLTPCPWPDSQNSQRDSRPFAGPPV